MRLKAPSLTALTLSLSLALSLGLAPTSRAADKTAPASEPRERQPIPLTEAPPVYPPAMAAAGIKGEVVVDFIVDFTGKVRDAKAFKQTNYAFGNAAVEAVSKWTFKPGIKNGKPVNTHMQVPLVFEPPAQKKP